VAARRTTTSVLALDNRAIFAVYEVAPQLGGFVHAYWTLSVETPPARVRIIPDGQIDLVFDVDRAEAHVGGAPNAAFEVTHERPTHLLGATLLPGAAAAFLDIPAGSLTVDWQPLAAVMGPTASELEQRLARAPDRIARLATLEAFLLSRLRQTDVRVDRAVRAIEETEGRVGIERLGRSCGASARNLSRLFHEWVGLPPKRFARIVRAQAALRRLTDAAPRDLAALAAELGFSDHAHLTREVQTLLGGAPSSLAETFKHRADSFKR
jgi:methylphosphotriester-DNA--protein-cysteine methyltransferase